MISESRVYDSAMIDALTVPAVAVVRDLRGLPLVYVYDDSRQRVFARRVEVGDLIGDEVEIKSGLRPDEQIVVAGQQNVHEGSLVQHCGRWPMNPVRASLRFPQVTLVLTAMLFVVGIAEFLTMPRREDPKITIRTGLVIADYPGATAEEVESQVTHKIEERLVPV